MKPTVFIQTNPNQRIGALVAAHALRRNSETPDAFDVRIMDQTDYPFFAAREGQRFLRGGKPHTWWNADLQSFTPLRFMPPELMGYQGRAIVIDPDIFAVADVWQLLSRDMNGKALMCVPRPGFQGIAEYYASSVMLLDCAQLRHWRCEEQFNSLFAFELDYLEWISLTLEPRASIGPLEPEWNHFDVLEGNTKLLHNTKRRTQPWKTGLPIEFTPTVTGWKKRARNWLQERQRRYLGSEWIAQRYKPHPDPRQEAFFFGLLRECLEEGTVTEELLRHEMRQDHVRHDALEVLDGTAPLPARGKMGAFASARDHSGSPGSLTVSR